MWGAFSPTAAHYDLWQTFLYLLRRIRGDVRGVCSSDQHGQEVWPCSSAGPKVLRRAARAVRAPPAIGPFAAHRHSDMSQISCCRPPARRRAWMLLRRADWLLSSPSRLDTSDFGQRDHGAPAASRSYENLGPSSPRRGVTRCAHGRSVACVTIHNCGLDPQGMDGPGRALVPGPELPA